MELRTLKQLIKLLTKLGRIGSFWYLTNHKPLPCMEPEILTTPQVF